MNKPAKIIIGVVVIALVVWAIVSGSHKKADQTAAADTIRVGIIAPLTGGASSYGIEGKNADIMALDEINAAGGIAGKKIEYFIEDGKCDAPTAASAWNKLVSVNRVQYIFGGHCSSETLTIAPLTSRDHVPAFATFTTSPKVANEGEWVFRNISTNEYYGTVLAEQAYKKGYRSVAVITEVKDFPVTYSDAFIRAFTAAGGRVALDERFDPTDKDYRTISLKLKGLKYDAIFVSTQASDAAALVSKQINDLRLAKPFLFNHTFAIAPFLKASVGWIPKDILSVTAFAAPDSPKLQKFNSDYFAKFGQAYNFTPFYVGAEYDLVYRWKDAAAACLNGGTDLTADCVRTQFQNAKSFSGVVGDNIEVSSKYSPHSIITPVGLVKISADGTSQTFEAIK